MKQLMILVLTGLMLASLPVQTTAQSGEIDMDRMNRDIEIMEGVLTQLFELDSNRQGSFARLSAGSTDVQGTYLPGYGVIFTIPSPATAFLLPETRFITEVRESERVDTPDEEQEEVMEEREETVARYNDLITDFLADYGSAIGQLRPDDQILVVYGKSLESTFGAWPVSYSSYQLNERQLLSVSRLPVISKSVSKRDLEALRSGQINRSTFENRIETVSENPEDQQERMDLELFANILQTALKADGSEEPVMNRTPTWFYLDNFGAFFQGSLSLQTGYSIFGAAPRIVRESDFNRFLSDSTQAVVSFYSPDSSRMVVSGRRDSIQALSEAEERVLEIVEQLDVQRTQQDSARQASIAEARAKIDSRLDLVRELMVDYGRTLSSLDSDQSLLIALDVQGPAAEKVHLRIQKSDLEEMENGAITRQQAMERITVTRAE